jgi:O-antigen/teichoic acid export membrane protein
MSWITGIGIDLSKKSYIALYCYFIFIATTVLAIWFTVGRYGILGVAFGVLFGHLVKSVAYTVLAYRCYPLRFSLKKPILLISLTFILGIAGQRPIMASLLYSYLMRGAILILMTVIVWKVLLSQRERELLSEKILVYWGNFIKA